MTKRALTLFCVLLCLIGMGGCKGEIANQSTGKLIGISYKRTVGSVYGENIYISLTSDEITYAECFSEGQSDYVITEHVSIESHTWEAAHTLVTAAYPYMTEITEPTPLQRMKERFLASRVLDGGDDTVITLVWETENGTVTKDYKTAYAQETTQLELWLADLAVATAAQEGEA